MVDWTRSYVNLLERIHIWNDSLNPTIMLCLSFFARYIKPLKFRISDCWIQFFAWLESIWLMATSPALMGRGISS
jgi:hypothetical protein